MSDIAIRFDGLIFAGVISISAIILAILALAFSARMRWSGGLHNAKGRARACWLGCVACLVSLAMLIFYLDNSSPPVSGPDLLDWAALPWAAILLAGVARLSRSPSR